MKEKKLFSLINNNGLIVPKYLLELKKDLNIGYDELLFLSFILSYEGDIPFDINRFKASLCMSDMDIMKIISSLVDKKLIAMNVIKDSGKSKEFIDVSIIKNKIFSIMIEEVKEDKEEVSNIYNVIEEEFARTLSPIECETIKGWLDAKIDEDMIRDALKEAILNGVTNLKYIDKILYEWKRNGRKKKDKNKEVKVFIPEDNWWDYDE